jgi:hypothetical protein
MGVDTPNTKKFYLNVYLNNGTFETMLTESEANNVVEAITDKKDLIINSFPAFRFISYRAIEAIRIEERGV